MKGVFFMGSTMINTGRFSQHVRKGIISSYEQRQDKLCCLFEEALKKFAEKVSEYPFDEFCWVDKELIVSIASYPNEGIAGIKIACVAPEDLYLLEKSLLSEPDFSTEISLDVDDDEVTHRFQKFEGAISRGKNFSETCVLYYRMDIDVEKYI